MILAGVVSCASAEAKKESHYKKGINYASRGQYPEAVVEFKNVIQLDPNDADAKYQLGLAYFKMGGLTNLQNAFKFLSEAVEKKPRSPGCASKAGKSLPSVERCQEGKRKVGLDPGERPESSGGPSDPG